MSIKIYSGYDEFKFEEDNVFSYLEIQNYEDDSIEEESEDLFFEPVKQSDFLDFSTFYIVSDLEDEENAEDISSYLGKFKKVNLPDIHKVVFFII
jgi:hypothetical protein